MKMHVSKLFITSPAVNALEPGHMIWDGGDKGYPGFAVQAGAKSKTYIYKTRIAGRVRWLKIGRTATWTPAAARKKAQRLQTEIDDGGDPKQEMTDNRSAPTVAEIAKDWMVHIRTSKSKTTRKLRSEKTIFLYGYVLDRFVLPEIGKMKPREVTKTDMENLHHAISAETPTQANLTLRVASAFFMWAEHPDQGYCQEGKSPCRTLTYNPEEERHYILDDEAAKRFGQTLEAMRSENVNPFALAGIELMAHTGARTSEILTAKRGRVSRERRMLFLETRKADGLPYIFLTDEALAIIDSLPVMADNPYLLPGRGNGHVSDDCIQRIWGKLRTRAGIICDDGKEVRLHDLRHNFASRMLALGAPIAAIQKQLGHRSINSTMRYLHADEKLVREGGSRAGNYLAAALAGKAPEPEPTQPTETPPENVVPFRKTA